MTVIARADTATTLATTLDRIRQLGPLLRERAVAAERVGWHADETIADLAAWDRSRHFPSSRGRAKQVEGGWMVSGGTWTFGSGAPWAPLLWAPFTNLDGTADDGQGPYVVGLQVPSDELGFLDDGHVAGMRATGSVGVTFDRFTPVS